MNDQQLLRYSRQVMLDGFDYEAQQCLLDSKALVIGLGGLGCPVAMYLAAAGVGQLWLADFDQVDLSNLQRQIAHGESDINRPKVISASEEIKRINSDTQVVSINEKLTNKLLCDAVASVDVVVDCSDNFSTRFEINRVCYSQKKPLVSGAAIRSEGQVAVFDPRNVLSPCYRCLYNDTLDDAQLSCSESGVLAPLVGVIGSIQALEAIKVLTSFGETLVGKLLVFDAKVMEWRKLTIPKNSVCPICSVQ